MWAAAVILEYSSSPAPADSDTASSDIARGGLMVALQIVDQTRHAEARDQRWVEAGRAATIQALAERGQTLLRMSEPELRRPEPCVRDPIPGRLLLRSGDGRVTGRSTRLEIAQQPRVHGSKAISGSDA